MSKDRVQLINEEYVSEGENFVDMQGMVEHIPKLFCTNKQNYVEKDIDSGLKSVQEEETIVDPDEADAIPELVQIKEIHDVL